MDQCPNFRDVLEATWQLNDLAQRHGRSPGHRSLVLRVGVQRDELPHQRHADADMVGDFGRYSAQIPKF